MHEFHRILLADTGRTLAYRDALRRLVSPGDVVLDLGTGTGILAFLACDAGAARVFAVDAGHVADTAFLLARHLGYGDRVAVFHGDSTTINVPQRARVLVTETLGVLGFDEGILGSVLDARKRLLLTDATIIPEKVALSLAPVELPLEHSRHVAWWGEPRYGYDLSALRIFASNTIYHFHIDAAALVAAPAEIAALELANVTQTTVSGSASFVAGRNRVLHGFAGWFAATLAPDLVISNRPPDTTHWGQAFFPLEFPVAVAPGARIDVALESPDGKVWRWRGVVQSTAGEVSFDQTTRLQSAPCRTGNSRSWRDHGSVRFLAKRLRRWIATPLH
jgi:SAM-dependent methyltransferase